MITLFIHINFTHSGMLLTISSLSFCFNLNCDKIFNIKDLLCKLNKLPQQFNNLHVQVQNQLTAGTHQVEYCWSHYKSYFFISQHMFKDLLLLFGTELYLMTAA